MPLKCVEHGSKLTGLIAWGFQKFGEVFKVVVEALVKE